jgi:hypothetical protein
LAKSGLSGKTGQIRTGIIRLEWERNHKVRATTIRLDQDSNYYIK